MCYLIVWARISCSILRNGTETWHTIRWDTYPYIKFNQVYSLINDNSRPNTHTPFGIRVTEYLAEVGMDVPGSWMSLQSVHDMCSKYDLVRKNRLSLNEMMLQGVYFCCCWIARHKIIDDRETNGSVPLPPHARGVVIYDLNAFAKKTIKHNLFGYGLTRIFTKNFGILKTQLQLGRLFVKEPVGRQLYCVTSYWPHDGFLLSHGFSMSRKNPTPHTILGIWWPLTVRYSLVVCPLYTGQIMEPSAVIELRRASRI